MKNEKIKPLTQTKVKQLTCPAHLKRIEYTCDAIHVPGLFVEVRRSGGMTYYLRYRDAQRRTRYYKVGRAMDIDLISAKKASLKARACILLGIYPGDDKQEKKQCMSYGSLFQTRYLKYCRPLKKSWRDDQKLYSKRLADRFGPIPLDQISLESVERFLGELTEEGLAASSVRHHGQLLKRCFSLALTWKLIDSNPLADLKLKQVNDAREYFLSDEELQRLLNVLDTDNARVPCLAAKLLLLTGCRVGELMQCRWQDLELLSDTPQLKVVREHSKNGRSRYVPISGEALKIIDQLPSKGVSKYLFTNSRNGERLKSIDKAWQRLRKEAGLPQLRLHDLRHNFASMLVNSGESLYTVQRILGHQSSDQSPGTHTSVVPRCRMLQTVSVAT